MNNLHRMLGSAAAALALSLSAPASSLAETVVRHVPQADLKVLDPVVNPAFITVQHSYMVYDQLFAWDDKGAPQPQMVDTYSVSEDGKTYRFTLRPGLKFHDGTPVRAADAIASIKRWTQKDPAGKRMIGWNMQLAAVDDLTFTLKLDVAYGQLLEVLGKPSWPLFVMREKDAALDVTTPVTEVVGSGPFRFVRDEWVPGGKVVYVKNQDYVPRKEPANFFAGGKVVKVDRVVWNIIPDASTAVAALGRGEVDIVETLPGDLLDVARQAKNVTVRPQKLSGLVGMMRLNHLHPPFNNPKAREALLYLTDQADYMRVAVGDERNWSVCYAYLVCDAPYGSEAGAEPYRKADIAKAKQLLAEAGYKGEKIVVMHPTNISVIREMSETSIQKMRQAGLNVDVQPMEWTTLLQRRFKADPPQQGGWHVWHTYSPGLDLANPVTSYVMDAPCAQTGWPGWACSPQLEKLRGEFALAPTAEARRKVGEEIQREAIKLVPVVLLGQFYSPISFRSSVQGLLETPIPVMWNVTRTD